VAPRFFVQSNLEPSSTIALSKEQSNHLVNVLKAKEGFQLSVFNGHDGQWNARVLNANKKNATLELIKQTRPQINTKKLQLFFAPTKNISSTYIVEKATELGATIISPIITERSIIRKVNVDKLLYSAIDASQQCGRLEIPVIENIYPLKEALSNLSSNDKFIFCDEASMRNSFKSIPSEDIQHTNSILIGPEGGFSYAEREYLRNLKSCITTHLGIRILRADTAVIAALSAYQAIFGDWNNE